MAEPITVFLGNTSPAVTDEIVSGLNQKGLNLTGFTVAFRMRRFDSTALKVNSPAIITNVSLGFVQYNWNAMGNDTDEPGSYRAWWNLTNGSLVQDTPEFEIVIDEHSPGFGTTTGAIAEGVKLFIPETITEMVKGRRFSDFHLQGAVNDMKMKLFATVVDAQLEATIYSAPVIDHVAKLVTLRIIPAGVDFWNNSLASQAATGTSEQSVYLDRRKGLWDIAKRLDAEVMGSGIAVDEDGNFVLINRPGRGSPAITYGQNNMLTPDPLDTEPLYGPRVPARALPVSRRAPYRVYP